MKVVTQVISVLLYQYANISIFASNKKITENMKEHKYELIQILGYVFAIIGHLILITWLSLLLNHSLNII